MSKVSDQAINLNFWKCIESNCNRINIGLITDDIHDFCCLYCKSTLMNIPVYLADRK